MNELPKELADLQVLVALRDEWSACACTAFRRAAFDPDGEERPTFANVHSIEPHQLDAALEARSDYHVLIVEQGEWPSLSVARPALCLVVAESECDLATRTVAAESPNLVLTEFLRPEELAPRSLLRTIRLAWIALRERQHRRKSELRFRSMLDGVKDGVWEWELEQNNFATSPKWRSLLGLRDGEVGGDIGDWLDRVHPEDAGPLRRSIRSHIDGRNSHHRFEHRVRRFDGSYVWMISHAVARRDREGRAVALSGSLTPISPTGAEVPASRPRDISERRATDSLRIASRGALIAQLEAILLRSADVVDSRFAILVVRLDRFRMVHDSIVDPRHGDRFISSIIQRLDQCRRGPHDTLARCDDEEFAFLLDGDVDLQTARRFAEGIQAALRVPFEIDGESLTVGISIGLIVGDHSYEHADDVLRDAKLALDHARTRGIPTQVFEPTLRVEAQKAVRLQHALRMAVLRDEFEVYYQPIVTVATGQLSGFEALVRWHHPERGIVHPAEFIPAAEEMGLILQIGQSVLARACRQVAEWQRRHPRLRHITLSVNLSVRQMLYPALEHEILEILEDSALQPGTLRLEITESTIIDDCAVAAECLARLRSHGVRIYIDDFGTGYSSLSYLQHLAVDGLKIDKSFLAGFRGPAHQPSPLVPSIVDLARRMGIAVVAEGVEQLEQLDHLREIACAEAQGYFFAPPLSSEAALKFAISRKSKLRGTGICSPPPAFDA